MEVGRGEGGDEEEGDQVEAIAGAGGREGRLAWRRRRDGRHGREMNAVEEERDLEEFRNLE